MDTYLKTRYKLEQMLDKGGMSKIYLAHDSKLGKQVVIKKIHVHETDDTMEMYKRLQHEYRFLSQINHPYIIRAYDFFEESKSFYLVLEYAQGMPLDYSLQKKVNFSILDIIVIAIQLCEAVNVLNNAGIIHRDVKPSNIIINEDAKQIKLVDLGISKSLSMEMTKITQEGMTVGTIDYMSPEQIMGKVSQFTDVFALAITLYQLFAWKPESPFSGDSLGETMKKVLHQPIPDISDCEAPFLYDYCKVYKEVANLIQDMSHKNPDKRASITHAIFVLRNIHQKLQNKSQSSWRLLPQMTSKELNKLKNLSMKYGYNI